MSRRQYLLSLAVLALSGLLGGGLSGWLFQTPAQAGSSKSLTVEELRLVDGEGRAKALLSLLRGKPRLILIDQKGEFRAELGLEADGSPGLWLRDREGRNRAVLALAEEGQPALTCSDPEKRPRLSLGLSGPGAPSLMMRDEAGQGRLALWQEKEELGLALADRAGRPRAGLVVKGDDQAQLVFHDQSMNMVWRAPPER
ncbi:MAG: hypothetical protein KKB20_17520 [Proteobacteria bacterium]|nr:hypothetical protein [Pseudomonadota bacterium]